MSCDFESDDENLLWTTASSASSDPDMSSEKVKHKRKKTHSQSETEVKNKLLDDIDYTTSNKYASSPKKSKKRKIKEEPENSDRASPAKKIIKTEHTSDAEVKTKKKKKKDKNREEENCTPNTVDSTEESQANDDSFLNLQIKQETFAKAEPVILKKKKKKLSASNASSEQSDTDTDSSKKKKSKKKRNKSVEESLANDDSFLNLQVKQETFAKPSPVILKKKNKNLSASNASSEQSDTDTDSSKKKKKSKKRNKSITDHSHSDTEQKIKQELFNAASESESSELQSTKKKKSKKDAKPDFYPSNEFVMDDDSSADEVSVPKPVTQKDTQGKKRKGSLNVSFANNVDKNSTKESHKPTSKAINGHISTEDTHASSGEAMNEPPSNRKDSVSNSSVKSISNYHQDTDSESDNNRKRTTSHTESLLNATAPAVISRHRISERITFEDEDESQSEIENKNDETIESSVSAGVNKYLLKNTTLKRVTTLLPSDHLISDDDDIWIIKCPHEVNINSMNGVVLSLDSKCKIRVNDQSYDGNIEEDINRLTILSSKNKKYVLKNIPIKGTIRFRKRIPKPHMRDDNIMPNNQTNFIPLPETKCRHPLFGINYKPALKLPSAVAQRLLGEGESFAEPMRSKKRRKHRGSATEPEPDTETEVVPKKKKRKRKHTDCDEEAPTKSKKIKRDPDAAGVWESEQAIEDNLFNF